MVIKANSLNITITEYLEHCRTPR